MTEQNLLFIDIDPKTDTSAADRRLWTRSDNSFRFNFVPDDSPTLQETTRLVSDRTAPPPPPPPLPLPPTQSQTSVPGAGAAFVFNFQIPAAAAAAAAPVEMMETEETIGASTEEKTSSQAEVTPPPEPSAPSKSKKKKKKSGKQVVQDGQATKEPEGGGQGGAGPELSEEEQFKRQLDWCIEQLELGLGSQKATPKQKEEASRALKTLHSSKAPLVKKRQVMRAMGGEYRKKMEEEKIKQFKLIQNEIASARVKVVSDVSKKPVFHRKAAAKAQTLNTEGNSQQAEAEVTQQITPSQEATPTLSFTTSKEEFRFNFL